EDLTRSTTANLGRIESVLKGVATQKPWLVVGCQGIGPAVRLDSGVHVLSRRTARSRTAVINHVIEGVDRARYLRLEQYRAQRSEPLSDLREPISDKKVKALLNPRGVNIATVDYDLIVELA